MNYSYGINLLPISSIINKIQLKSHYINIKFVLRNKSNLCLRNKIKEISTEREIVS